MSAKANQAPDHATMGTRPSQLKTAEAEPTERLAANYGVEPNPPAHPPQRLLVLQAIESRGAVGIRDVDLILLLWRNLPSVWCLEGHPEHPDSNKIRAKLSQLVADGYVRRPRPCLNVVTKAGARFAKKAMRKWEVQ